VRFVIPTVPPEPAPLPDTAEDFSAMAALARGEPGAFDRLSERWRPRIVNFCRGLGADAHGAEDCAQEALLRVYRYRADYRPDVPFAAFLFTLARRSFLDWRRRTSRWAARAAPLDGDEVGVDPRSPAATGAAGDRLDLAVAVASLPRRLREVVELAAIRGLPYDRVGVLLGIPVGTVKSRMHHAVRRLRGVLGDAPPEAHA
jgi:RNA polymerase sigma factor (sigma-70 family)